MTAPTIKLRPFAAGDIATLRSWIADEAAAVQWGGVEVPFPLTDAFFAAILAECGRVPPLRWAAMGILDGQPVAHAQVALDHRHGVGRLARILVAPERRGAGLAVPFLAGVIAEAWTRWPLEHVELNVYTFNAAAIRTYERLGFQLEGVRRSSARVGNERWDTAMMGLLRNEAQASKP